jgi:hypothetical protein
LYSKSIEARSCHDGYDRWTYVGDCSFPRRRLHASPQALLPCFCTSTEYASHCGSIRHIHYDPLLLRIAGGFLPWNLLFEVAKAAILFWASRCERLIEVGNVLFYSPLISPKPVVGIDDQDHGRYDVVGVTKPLQKEGWTVLRRIMACFSAG